MPAATESQVVAVTPSSRSSNVSTRPTGLRGRSSRNSMYRGMAKYGSSSMHPRVDIAARFDLRSQRRSGAVSGGDDGIRIGIAVRDGDHERRGVIRKGALERGQERGLE